MMELSILERTYLEAKKEVENGDISWAYNLGFILLDDDFAEYDVDKAIYWLERFIMEVDHIDGRDSDLTDFEDAREKLDDIQEKRVSREQFEQVQVAAEGGNPDSQFQLGEYYLSAEKYYLHFRLDYVEALKWFSKSAEQGHAESMYQMGLAYQKGRGVEANPKLGFDWTTKSAQAGFDYANTELAWLFLQGIGTNQDIDRAISMYEERAMGGCQYSTHMLGLIYSDEEEYGRINNSEALFWFAKELMLDKDMRIKTLMWKSVMYGLEEERSFKKTTRVID